ncbi:MAG: PAS domain S-box protein [Candidatus Marinimicrobia bacterium]|nr:PAS domain S-box protein [Candidatus Neomarinimicrobiota bacterium]
MKNKPSDTVNHSIDTVTEAVFIVELPSRKIKYVNNSLEVVFGYEYEECIGKTTELFYPGIKDFKSFGVRLKKAIKQNKEALQVETRLKRKNGEIFPAEISTSIMRTGDRVNQVISVVRDLTVEKHAQEALQESEEKYKTFFRESNDAIYLTSTDGKFEDVNDSLRNLFGYSKEELMSMDVADLYYNREEREKFRREIETKGSVKDYSLSLKKKDGTEIFCLLTSNVRRNQNDKIIGYQGIIRDISSKIKAEEELQKFSNAIEQASEMILISDSEGNIQYVNPEFERLTGFNKQDVLGKTPRILKSGKHPEEFYKKMWATILAGDTFRGLIINKKKNGDLYYEEKIISPLKDADGNVTNFVSNGRDITERINAQKKIEEQRKFLRQVLDINPNIIFAKDREGKFTLANKAMAELLNTTIKNIIGKTSRDFNLDEEGQAMILRDDKDVFDTLREVNSPENTLIDPKGNKHIFHTIKRPVIDENGNASHILAVLMDITDQKKSENEKFNLERKLERARRMESLGILAGGVAHDLNNILGPILGYPDLILSTLPQNSPIRGDIEMIKASAERASDVVQDLLTLARRGKYEMKVLDINKLITEYVNSSVFDSKKSKYPDVKVKLSLKENLSAVRGSEPHLAKAIMNLTINAFESMLHGGTLSIRTHIRTIPKQNLLLNEIPEGEYVIIEVEDSGYGIANEDLTRIFEPFYTRKEMGSSGSGLGLSVVLGVVEDHGGYVDVSTEKGIGTKFSIYLQPSPFLEENLTTPDKNLRGTENILVVDDGSEQRTLAERLITSLGYKVDSVDSGNAAIEKIKKKNFDLIILDMIIEDDFDGLDTFKEIIKFRPDQKAIIVSGYAETGRVKEARKLGVGKYIRKPYSLDKIGTAIRYELDRK